MRHLDESQRRQYENSGMFHVFGKSGRIYRILPRLGWSVEVFGRDWACITTICIVPRVKCPIADHQLALKLIIETDEELVFKIGNLTFVQAPPTPLPLPPLEPPTAAECVAAGVVLCGLLGLAWHIVSLLWASFNGA